MPNPGGIAPTPTAPMAAVVVALWTPHGVYYPSPSAWLIKKLPPEKEWEYSHTGCVAIIKHFINFHTFTVLFLLNMTILSYFVIKK